MLRDMNGGKHLDLMQYPREDYSIAHFARPNSYELSGKELYLVMDSGYNYILKFVGNICRWCAEGQEAFEAEYMCFKADNTTYFLSFEKNTKENHTYVIDMAQRLVTQLICRKGVHPINPHIMDRQFVFGAIKVPGYKLPYKRHTFSSEHLGTTAQWRWSPSLFTRHAYLESNWYRITWEDDGEASEDFDSTNEMLPSTDEHAKYIKIKDNMYLFSVTEETEERLLGDIQHFRCDNLALLQNYDRMFQVGRGFGDMVLDGKLKHLNIPLAAFGSPIELPEDFLNAKNPFTV